MVIPSIVRLILASILSTGISRMASNRRPPSASLTSAALLKHYERTLAAYCGAVRDFCARRGAVYVLTDSAQPVDRLVLEQLRRRQLLA